MNLMLLYCKDREQVVFWDVCKAKKCTHQKCIFSKAVKRFGTDGLFSTVPKRYSTLTQIENDLGPLKTAFDNRPQPKPIIQRTPVQGGVIQRTPIQGGTIQRTPVQTLKTATGAPGTSFGLMDLIKEEIQKELSEN